MRDAPYPCELQTLPGGHGSRKDRLGVPGPELSSRAGRWSAGPAGAQGPAGVNCSDTNDIVVEVPAIINKKGANGKKLDNYPKTFGALLNSQTGVIQLTTEAILNKSKHGAYLALLSDPIVDDAIKAEKLLNTMINKQSKFLGYLN